MSRRTTRAMTLGVIASRGPISGYGIERTFAEWAVDRWTTISAASVYQQLRTLSTQGLIEPVAGRSGRATDYRCTPAGHTELRSMLLEMLGERDVRPLGLVPLLYFTPFLSRRELVDGLSARLAALDDALAVEDEMLARAAAVGPSHVLEIFRLNWHGLRADRVWCEEFRQRLLDRDHPDDDPDDKADDTPDDEPAR